MKLKCTRCHTEFEPGDGANETVECPDCGHKMKMGSRGSRGNSGSRRPASSRPASTWGTEPGTDGGLDEEYVDISPGEQLAGFRIDEKLGEGSMGLVFKATQLSLNRPVALKVLPERFADNPQFVKRFDQESDALAALNHPNIVSIIDRGRVGKTYFFAMEYVEGTNLHEMMRGEDIDHEFFLRIMKQCCEGLKYAHSKGIIHRDIKPSNIMLDDEGRARLADFGLAGMLAEQKARKGHRRISLGTHGYMPPEQEYDVSEADERSDVYAFGALMYTVLTGKIPKDRPFTPPSERSDDVDPRLDAIIMKSLEEKPDDRYQTAGELLDALDTYMEALTSVGELCPECKSQNPPREKTCLECGADLSEFFDPCPECGHENRRDVEICLNCGCNIKQIQEKYSIQIGKVRDQARRLMKQGEYDEAIRRLESIKKAPGKIFEKAREKADRRIEQCKRKKQERIDRKKEKAEKCVEDAELAKAVEILETISDPDETVEDRIQELKSSMDECRGIAEQALKRAEDYDLEGAEELVEKAEGIWTSCPKLEEARDEVQSVKDTEHTIEYELQEADKCLQDGNFDEARESLQFALASVPDHPKLKSKMAEIDRAEKRVKLDRAIHEGKEYYEENRFQEAALAWGEALELLDEDDAHREQLEKKIRVAEKKAKGPDAVSPETPLDEPAPGPTPTGRAASPAKKKKGAPRWGIMAAVGATIVLLGGGALIFFLSQQNDTDTPRRVARPTGPRPTDPSPGEQPEPPEPEPDEPEPPEPDPDGEEPPEPEPEPDRPEPPDEPEEPPEPEGVQIAELPNQGIQGLGIGQAPFQIQATLAGDAVQWQMATGNPIISGGHLRTRNFQTTLSILRPVTGSDLDITGRCQIQRVNARDSNRALGLVARFKDPKNYLLMGLRGTEKGFVEPYICGFKNGQQTASAIKKPKTIVPMNKELMLRLIVKGNRAVGIINGKRLLELKDLGRVAPDSGYAGLFSQGMRTRWNRFSASSSTLLDVSPPKDATIKTTGNSIQFKRCGLKPVVLKHFEAQNARLTLNATIGEETGRHGISQIAIYGRLDENGQTVYMTVDIAPRKGLPSRVSLLGKVQRRGQLVGGTYTRAKGPNLWHGDSVKLSLHLQNGRVHGYINGKRVISARHKANQPVPQHSGSWGFRMTYLKGSINGISIRQ